MVDELLQLFGCPSECNAAADVEQRGLRFGQSPHDLRCRFLVERGFGQRFGVLAQAVEQARFDPGREDIHRHVDEHRAGLTVFGQGERLLDDFREQLRGVHAPGTLHERPINLVLRCVRMQVHLLVRVLAVIMGRHVPGDDHHGDAVEGGVRDAGRRVGEPGAQMREQHGRLAGGTGIAVGRVGRDLLVPDVDEMDCAVRHGGQHGNVGVSAQSEDVPHAPLLQVTDQEIGNQVFHRRLRSGPSREEGPGERVAPFPRPRLAGRIKGFRYCRTRRTVPPRSAGPREWVG